MASSYELYLFRPTQPRTNPSLEQIERGENVDPLDQLAVGSFLLSLGPQIRFGAATELGDQYLYEDTDGADLEMIVSLTHLAIGSPFWSHAQMKERVQRVADAIALAAVARLGLTMYDPQRKRYIRSAQSLK